MLGGGYGSTARQRTNCIFSLLSDSRRRVVLYVVADDGRATVDELVDTILANEGNSRPTEREREQVVVSLLHKHLPKLADAGVVEHRTETETVVRSDGIDRLEPFLSAIPADDAPAESNLLLAD